MCTYLTLGTSVIAATITAGWSVLTSVILLMSLGGRRQPLEAEFGATAASRAMVLTCSWSPVTRSIRAVIGWAAKRLSACKPDRLLPVSLPTIGRLLFACRLLKPIPTLGR